MIDERPEETPAASSKAPDTGTGCQFSQGGVEGAQGYGREDGGRAEAVSAERTAAETTAEEAIEAAWDDLDYRAHVGLRYFRRRRAWFDGISNFSAAVSALAGSGAFGAIIGGEKWIASSLAAVAAMFGAITVAYKPAERAREAHDFVRKYASFIADLSRVEQRSDDHVKNFTARLYEIAAEAPSPIVTLEMICQNRESRIRGTTLKDLYYIPHHKILFCHIFTVPPDHWISVEERATLRAARPESMRKKIMKRLLSIRQN